MEIWAPILVGVAVVLFAFAAASAPTLWERLGLCGLAAWAGAELILMVN